MYLGMNILKEQNVCVVKPLANIMQEIVAIGLLPELTLP